MDDDMDTDSDIIYKDTKGINMSDIQTPKEKTLIKLNLGAGQRPIDGFKSVDIMKGSEIEMDLFKFPWDFEDESVTEIISQHFFEHVPQELRFKFMEEVYRILTWGSGATFVTPYYNSMRAVQDPTHMFPPIAESSYAYFNKKWRDDNLLSHYNVKCDFDFSYSYIFMDPRWINASQDARDFAIKYYTNVVADLQTLLVKTKR
jgi:hypothetical protein